MMTNRYGFIASRMTVKHAVLCGLAFIAVGLALAGVLVNSDRARTSKTAAIETVQRPAFIDVDVARIEHVAAPPPIPPEEKETHE